MNKKTVIKALNIIAITSIVVCSIESAVAQPSFEGLVGLTDQAGLNQDNREPYYFNKAKQAPDILNDANRSRKAGKHEEAARGFFQAATLYHDYYIITYGPWEGVNTDFFQLALAIENYKKAGDEFVLAKNNAEANKAYLEAAKLYDRMERVQKRANKLKEAERYSQQAREMRNKAAEVMHKN